MDFRRALAISAWTFLAVSVVSTPLMLLVVYLKDEWNWPAPELLQAGPALLVERGSISRPLWTLLQGLDLFSLWTVSSWPSASAWRASALSAARSGAWELPGS